MRLRLFLNRLIHLATWLRYAKPISFHPKDDAQERMTKSWTSVSSWTMTLLRPCHSLSRHTLKPKVYAIATDNVVTEWAASDTWFPLSPCSLFGFHLWSCPANWWYTLYYIYTSCTMSTYTSLSNFNYYTKSF